jgi:protein canopy 3/4
LEENEEAIEEWYFNLQNEIPLETYLCSQRALKGDDDSCLLEKVSTDSSKKDTKLSDKSDNGKVKVEL